MNTITIADIEYQYLPDVTFEDQSPELKEAIHSHIANTAATTIEPCPIWADERPGALIYTLPTVAIHVTPNYVYNERPRLAIYFNAITINTIT